MKSLNGCQPVLFALGYQGFKSKVSEVLKGRLGNSP
jgi:hypothetical protein